MVYFCLQLSFNFVYEHSRKLYSKNFENLVNLDAGIDNTTNKNNSNFIVINSFTKQNHLMFIARKQVFVPLHFYRLFVI